MEKKYLVSALIKFGEKEYMEQLLKNGTICMNRLSFYKKHYNQEIQDKNEATFYNMPNKDAKIFINGTYIRNNLNGSIKISNEDYNPLIYCMYAEYINNPIEYKNKIYIDDRVFNFGESAVIINDPKIFLERILKYYPNMEYSKVRYIDENEYKGNMNYFFKYDKYRHQQEYRFVYKNDDNKERLIFDIGSIEDIARIEYFK